MLFFDLDGPILDVTRRYYVAYCDVVGSFGGKALDESTYWQLKQSKTPVEEILARTGVSCDASQYRRVRNALIERSDYLSYDHIWEPLVEVYCRLFAAQAGVLVTLRTDRRALDEQLKRLGITDWFGRVLSGPSDASERWKTKVGFVESAFAAGTLNASENFFFGDTETDIRTGRTLGMTTVAVSFGIRDRGLLIREAPDFLFDRPAELAEFICGQMLETSSGAKAEQGIPIQ